MIVKVNLRYFVPTLDFVRRSFDPFLVEVSCGQIPGGLKEEGGSPPLQIYLKFVTELVTEWTKGPTPGPTPSIKKTHERWGRGIMTAILYELNFASMSFPPVTILA